MDRPAWIKKALVDGSEQYLISDLNDNWFKLSHWASQEGCLIHLRTLKQRAADVYHCRRDYSWEETIGIDKPRTREFTRTKMNPVIYRTDKINKAMFDMSQRKLA